MNKNLIGWLVGWLVGLGVLAGPGTPRDPKSHLFVTNWVAIQPFCAILQPNLRRIPARFSPDRSHPLNLNFCFHKIGPDFNGMCDCLTHFRIISAPCWTHILIFFSSQNCPKRALGALGGPYFPIYFPLFSPCFSPCGGPYFSFYTTVILSPLFASMMLPSSGAFRPNGDLAMTIVLPRLACWQSRPNTAQQQRTASHGKIGSPHRGEKLGEIEEK